MRHDDLGCQKIRVLDVVDGLAGRFHAQLVGVHVHGGQLRAGDAGEQRVVEGHDGKVFRDAQPQLAAELFQHHSKDVVADQHGGGAVQRGEQGLQRFFVSIVQGVDFQFKFDEQWRKLKAYANSKGIRIIGDIPIYVPLDSADVWSHPENFQLTRTRRPRVVAGCPPDGFNANGQYWGNPIYDWERMEQDGFSWWMRRLRAAGENFDVVRIDHFRGIESYWAIPAVNRTARKGEWIQGPGMKLVRAIRENCPDTDFIAEDLGFLTPEVQKLVKESGFPGMKVLEFAFDPREPSNYLPDRYPENCICYTGTHDNETLIQWCEGLDAECDAYAREYLGIGAADDLADAIIEAGMQSRAQLFIMQMQDYLRLGKEARMNEPGRLLPSNWRWRMLPGAANDALAAKIAGLTARANRV
mgnify:CR=1 FL=1